MQRIKSSGTEEKGKRQINREKGKKVTEGGLKRNISGQNH